MAFSFLSKKSKGPSKKFSFVSFDALADWKKIVYVGLALFIAAVAWSGYVFWSIQSGVGLAQGSDPASAKKVRAISSGLQQISDIYSGKSDHFQLLLTTLPSVVDPSK